VSSDNRMGQTDFAAIKTSRNIGLSAVVRSVAASSEICPGQPRYGRPLAAIDLPYAMLLCGPSDRPFAATAKSVDGRTHNLQDEATFCSAAIADAASAPSRGDGCLVVQHNSPKLPFKRVNRAGSQTDLSLHVA
jgi:hypothetical protein